MPQVAAAAALQRVPVLQAQVMFTCNNACWFCLDRNEVDGEFHGGPPVVPFARIEALLRAHAGQLRAVMFTHGEPTLHPQLPQMIALARALGYGHVGVVSNGRKLGDATYARALCEAGANRFVISIHGPDAETHDACVGKQAFGEASAGLGNLAALKGEFPLQLTTSTVASRLNLGKLCQTATFVIDAGADRAVVNVVRPTGHAAKHFEKVVPPYRDLVAALTPWMNEPPERRNRLVVEDIPPCAAGPLAPLVGTLEAWVVPKGDESATAPRAKARLFAGQIAPPAAMENGVTGELAKRPQCQDCVHNGHCWGVWQAYATAYGWQEFAPVLATPASSQFEVAATAALGPQEVASALPSAWRLQNWTLDGKHDRLLLDLHGGAQSLRVIVTAAAPDARAYLRAAPWAWSYASAEFSADIDAVLRTLATAFAAQEHPT